MRDRERERVSQPPRVKRERGRESVDPRGLCSFVYVFVCEIELVRVCVVTFLIALGRVRVLTFLIVRARDRVVVSVFTFLIARVVVSVFTFLITRVVMCALTFLITRSITRVVEHRGGFTRRLTGGY
jgi:hypothetical protein